MFLNTTLIASALFGASALQAQEIENTGNIYIGGVGFFPDTKHNVDDDTFFVIGGEIPISERWSVAADYFSVDTDTYVTNISSDLDF